MAEPGRIGPSPVVLVLASASPARAALLRSSGIRPRVLTSSVDEAALVEALSAGDPGIVADARRLTQALADAKARDVAERIRAEGVEEPAVAGGADPGWIGGRVVVVGADSMLDVGGQVVGKAATAQEVRDRWATMAGGTGVLVTGHTVIDVASGHVQRAAVATTVRFGRPDPAELEAYIASGEPLAVAGSCTIDGLGAAFIDGVDGDHTNVIGLALPTVRALLGELGVRWTDLWALD